MELGKVICVADPAEAAARDAAMIAAAAARSTDRDARRRMPIGPGVLLARRRRTPASSSCRDEVRRRGTQRACFDDVVGRGWTLLSHRRRSRWPISTPSRRRSSRRSAASPRTSATAAVDDVDGAYRRWFAEHGVGVVLQRPDFYVFGSAARVEDAGLLVREVPAMRLLSDTEPRRSRDPCVRAAPPECRRRRLACHRRCAGGRGAARRCRRTSR